MFQPNNNSNTVEECRFSGCKLFKQSLIIATAMPIVNRKKLFSFVTFFPAYHRILRWARTVSAWLIGNSRNDAGTTGYELAKQPVAIDF